MLTLWLNVIESFLCAQHWTGNYIVNKAVSALRALMTSNPKTPLLFAMEELQLETEGILGKASNYSIFKLFRKHPGRVERQPVLKAQRHGKRCQPT